MKKNMKKLGSEKLKENVIEYLSNIWMEESFLKLKQKTVEPVSLRKRMINLI